MAKINDVPADHRRHAEVVPQDVLGRLSAAELRHRCAHVEDLHQSADHNQAEQARHLTGRARRVLRSRPVLDYVIEDKRLSDLAQRSSRQVHHDDQGRQHTIAGDIECARREHRDEHAYPPGLAQAIGRRLLGQAAGDPGLNALADEIIAHHA